MGSATRRRAHAAVTTTSPSTWRSAARYLTDVADQVGRLPVVVGVSTFGSQRDDVVEAGAQLVPVEPSRVDRFEAQLTDPPVPLLPRIRKRRAVLELVRFSVSDRCWWSGVHIVPCHGSGAGSGMAIHAYHVMDSSCST